MFEPPPTEKPETTEKRNRKIVETIIAGNLGPHSFHNFLFLMWSPFFSPFFICRPLCQLNYKELFE